METPTSHRHQPWFNLALAGSSILALAGLVLEYGFLQFDPVAGQTVRIGPMPIEWIRAGEMLAAGVFAVLAWAQLAGSTGRLTYLKDHLLELIFAVAVLAALGLILLRPETIAPDRRILLTKALQIYLLLQLIVIFVKLNALLVRSMLHPFRGIVSSFAVLIIVGAMLLSLPSASDHDRFSSFSHNFVDHVFTATSAVCVTGLTVRDTGTDYTLFGQVVILILMQLGALGIVIFGTIFAILIGQQISLREATVVHDLYSEYGLGQIKRIVKFVIVSTLIIESIGAVLIFGMWHEPTLDQPQRVFESIFHAVSAYCNAGFSLQSDNLVSYADKWQVYLGIMPLIIIGGLGFPVLLNLAQLARQRVARTFIRTRAKQDLDQYRQVRLTLQSKIVLTSSVVLVILGAAAIFLIESPSRQTRWSRKVQYEDRAVQVTEHVTRYHSVPHRLLDATFQSVSARTAGFNTINTDRGSLHPATFIILMALMFIGGSPASTAGGLKIVTFVLLLAAVAATLRRRPNVEMFKRRIDPPLIRRAMTLAILFFIFVWLLSVALVITHPDIHQQELLFEAVSACGTVGYSTGVTQHLNLTGRICIIIGMFVGRLGPLTLLFALTKTGKTIRYEYPREGLVIG